MAARGAVADLARLLGDGRVVSLSRAVRSGPVWSLDFALGHLSFPVLAGAITLAPGGGGAVAPVTSPNSPAPGLARW